MKRILSLTLLLSTSTFAAFAWGGTGGADKQVVLFFGNAVAILLTIWMASFFLLSIIRLFLSYRLRRELVEKNASPEVIAQILPPKSNLAQIALKWCCLFAALGLGFTICYLSQPIGLHWTVILSFSLAAGLLIFYFISRRFE